MTQLLTLAVLQMSLAQPETSMGLYALEKVAPGGIVVKHNLVRLSLDRDKQMVKEVLLVKDQRFFSHFGGHRLVLDRFVVSTHGGVIDIPARKVINDEQDGQLLGIDEGKVFYRIDNSRRASGLFAFDLKTNMVGKAAAGQHWDLPAQNPRTVR